MNKGFTLKSFLVVLVLIVFMGLIAFFVQRKEKEPLPPENEIEEEIVLDETLEPEIDNQEKQDYKNNNDNEENDQLIDFQEEATEVDCGEADYLASKVKQDLVSRKGASLIDIKITSCQGDFFSDHTLGTSGPGEVYPQTLTSGYVIILSWNEQEYRYHANDNTILFVN